MIGMMNTTRFRCTCWLVVVSVVGACLWATRRAEAQLTQVVWQAKIGGKIGIQGFDSKVMPKLDSAKFKGQDFLRTIFGTNQPVQEFAITINMQPDGTNIFLSIFNTATRENFKITTDEQTTLFQDNKKVVFDVSADVPEGINIIGGHLRITGSGKVVGGVPAKLKADVGGYLVERDPSDLGGTTGMLMHTTLSTSGKPLRALPSSGP